MDILAWIILVVVALSGASIVVYTLENGITPSPTGGRAKRRLLDIVDALPSASHIYELGSGWGTLAFPIAARCPGARVTGIENSIVPYIVSRLRLAVCAASARPHLIRGNFHDVDLSDADLIVCYQSPGNMSKLRPKFDAELSGNAIVVSNTFAVPGWKPTRTHQADDLFKTRIYVYQVADARPRRPE